MSNSTRLQGTDQFSNITSDGSKERSASSNSTTLREPKSPWMPFPMLFEAISKQVPQNNMKLLLAYYELFRVCFVFVSAFCIFMFSIPVTSVSIVIVISEQDHFSRGFC